MAIQSVKERSVAVRGPYRTPDAARVAIVRQPIFISGVDADEVGDWNGRWRMVSRTFVANDRICTTTRPACRRPLGFWG